ncbi:undecaprenyldiphospho-muramoylpentapeptide beta-N-acetylglucosaminyltransferase [Caldalkalibacillus salinus]|uniref:undecaprenyldiphospho-muramoylpentapeptide beta-N-acetylglucosaminyltransferase n=1 Tax=Caldalkalibacillus salinus TaxID=2803787 RepID=UPI00192427F3|nr:undecaprenyldiphospho-muramoylpentapeptide beta-N-acetylglucosaminyltransferase [Caldalkalibacillus salinus]
MRVLISGGGTGGHIYPALSILKEVRRREPDSHFLYIGTEKGLEASIVPKTDVPFKTIDITGFKRKLSFDNVKTVLRFLRGVRRSKAYIRDFQPDIVIGTGGYVCGPVVFAAAKLGIPTLIHEQNVIPGLTNKFLARYTTAVATSFAGSLPYFKHENVKVTGNPRATEVREADPKEGRRSLNIPSDKKVILIVGGSRGAKAINQAFMDMVPRLQEMKDTHFVYVTGEVHYEEVQQTLRQFDLEDMPLTVKPFIYDLPHVLASTDLIVNRAGASFLAEITSLGIPSILVPSPYVTNNHQEKNARWLEKEGAAKVILEDELTGQSLYDMINQMMKNEEEQIDMKQAAQRLGKPLASSDIYEWMQRLIQS